MKVTKEVLDYHIMLCEKIIADIKKEFPHYFRVSKTNKDLKPNIRPNCMQSTEVNVVLYPTGYNIWFEFSTGLEGETEQPAFGFIFDDVCGFYPYLYIYSCRYTWIRQLFELLKGIERIYPIRVVDEGDFEYPLSVSDFISQNK